MEFLDSEANILRPSRKSSKHYDGSKTSAATANSVLLSVYQKKNPLKSETTIFMDCIEVQFEWFEDQNIVELCDESQ